MTTLTYPAGLYVPQGGSFSLVSNTFSFTSPLSNIVQTLEYPGSRWSANISYAALSETNSRLLASFLAQLRGQAGRFYYGDPFHRTPQGSGLGTPIVYGASQTGSSIETTGWDPLETNVLKAGDYIQFTNNEMKIVTADVDTNSSGDATITFEPPIRNSPSDSTSITIQDAKAVMRLTDDNQATWEYGNIAAASFSLSFIESFT
jgi:hypothetical protein